MLRDQPILFTPIYQSRVWGGRRMETLLGATLPDETTPYGEAWTVADRPEAQSVTADGVSLHELWTNHREEVFGKALLASTSPTFPLLMKILDACDDLSIQVHPPASMAAALKGEPKTEMWFIAHADPGAKIYAGLKPGVTRTAFEKALQNGTVTEVVHVIEARTGDCLFIPSGRVHAIGAGLLIYEIQQNSDTTYRVFDWNRVGLDGKPRALHVQESLQSIDFADFEPQVQQIEADGTLVKCDYFDVRLRDTAGAVGEAGECVTLAVVSGEISVGRVILKAGDFALLPAGMTLQSREVKPANATSQWLEIRVPA
ncbi:type I phosphomannose isomerase catalytic subunit [Prosthecobacter sp.]|uniref:type I phosphomannose isomerase catalytic subunit n=1 Tax=Prosthecobacter sp. TaxID=1965333 RepID=UPI002ABC8A4B|nr:type I phosphomannose isomerase catalytic subunit [Prosthecobacter sp.]MDZ4404644.1 type I phosphomannose isomerase catalytic subunit [Prosthecobacter sp.]